mmetsp:Transcript_7518/g.15688  ORF Transcript_7518/g.15688 Transcript_7518/m.15688 type:complete len:626 (+) Transcript_7518:51-1928(+)
MESSIGAGKGGPGDKEGPNETATEEVSKMSDGQPRPNTDKNEQGIQIEKVTENKADPIKGLNRVKASPQKTVVKNRVVAPPLAARPEGLPREKPKVSAPTLLFNAKRHKLPLAARPPAPPPLPKKLLVPSLPAIAARPQKPAAKSASGPSTSSKTGGLLKKVDSAATTKTVVKKKKKPESPSKKSSAGGAKKSPPKKTNKEAVFRSKRPLPTSKTATAQLAHKKAAAKKHPPPTKKTPKPDTSSKEAAMQEIMKISKSKVAANKAAVVTKTKNLIPKERDIASSLLPQPQFKGPLPQDHGKHPGLAPIAPGVPMVSGLTPQQQLAHEEYSRRYWHHRMMQQHQQQQQQMFLLAKHGTSGTAATAANEPSSSSSVKSERPSSEHLQQLQHQAGAMPPWSQSAAQAGAHPHAYLHAHQAHGVNQHGYSSNTVRSKIVPRDSSTVPVDAASVQAKSPPASSKPGRRRLAISRKMIEASIPQEACGIFQIYGRRINLDNLIDSGNTSIYALLRAWVQDDPFRKTPHPLSHLHEHDDEGRIDTRSLGSSCIATGISTAPRSSTQKTTTSEPKNLLSLIGNSSREDTDEIDGFVNRGKRRRLEIAKQHETETSREVERLRKRGIYIVDQRV